MSSDPAAGNELLPNLFRLEYTRMTAVLYRRFGLKYIEIAEDIVSETFKKASENWTINGIPENPAAWLYKVAKNKAKDCLKHHAVVETHFKETIATEKMEMINDFEFTHQNISDSQLSMIFAVCNPAISSESQICLALQILCGFSVEEIANAFLSKIETIKKRLQRARADLRKDNFQIGILNKNEIALRIDTVLKTLYLLFNEGYFSKTNSRQIRKDLCLEALRLTLLLTENPLTNTPKANALLALMCYQSSRLDARTNDKGETIVYERQNKKLWDVSLIERGNYYLIEACNRDDVSKYHLEAAIAYWHTVPAGKNKWQQILQLYNQLILVEYSPIAALNRTFAFAKVYGHEQAIAEAQKLNLAENNYYHELLGYLFASYSPGKAITHYEKAIQLTKSEAEKQTLQKEIRRLRSKGTTGTGNKK
ncbi:sigma-70 family RNA polymerase sigma factor [Mucilaginibacter sabulilitoris]|uniref:Sigma-70 family RNA polymerase sigma factor n=1 Tax=Mucilaginibacter sabulilitoris TaxID=1173583 RepID=A0ABZ0TNM2_9SPHI|nr:sigma-70 family RNA polymerase sigma factor [Mucilaginibacter sabulilitoris]WPU93708.1 sigma-70 family RNA polymerase sigma factor [Mucilaginibacter sabulilitoris]